MNYADYGFRSENWTEKMTVLASGDKDAILDYYTRLYYKQVAESLEAGSTPGAMAAGEANARELPETP